MRSALCGARIAFVVSPDYVPNSIRYHGFMRTVASCLGLLLLIGPTSPSTAELPTLVQSALARGAGSAGGWGYTMSTVEYGVTTVERFDPDAADGGWTLVSVDGKPPSKKQLKKYAAKSGTRESRDHPGEIDFADIVDPDSIALVAESTRSATFRFKPAPDESGDDDPTSAFLDGTLFVDKTGPFVDSLELANTDPFSAATGVKIHRMRVRMEFVHDRRGRVVLSELSQSVEGRLFGMKSINQASTVTYSEFARPD